MNELEDGFSFGDGSDENYEEIVRNNGGSGSRQSAKVQGNTSGRTNVQRSGGQAHPNTAMRDAVPDPQNPVNRRRVVKNRRNQSGGSSGQGNYGGNGQTGYGQGNYGGNGQAGYGGNMSGGNPNYAGGTGYEGGVNPNVNNPYVQGGFVQGVNPNIAGGAGSGGSVDTGSGGTESGGSSKGGFGMKVLVVVMFVAVVVVGVLIVQKVSGGGNGDGDGIASVPYKSTGKYYFDTLCSMINAYNPENIDSIVGVDAGDSYVAQEWAYANNNPSREAFIKAVASVIEFSYPDGSTMSNGEAVTVTVPDYDTIAAKVEADSENILDMELHAGIEKEDYDYQDECFDLFCEWFVQLEEIPTTTVDVQMYLQNSVFVDDIELDKAMFSSDSYHNMTDAFDKVLTGYTGYVTEKYTEKEEVHNDEFDEWFREFEKRYDADGGKFNKYTSDWEPWYVYDKNNKVQRDKKGEKLVRYYSIKDENGKDWIQPPETILKDVEKEHEVPIEYVPEQAVPRCYLGAYYAQNEYDGEVEASIRVGDGTVDEPAGVGTPVITKVLCKDGRYHDVRVTMKGYWVGIDAINYAVTFSEKNRGFDPKSPVQLVCFEIQVDNLEKADISFDSEMMLCDEFASQTGRAGTMYGFTYEDINVKAGGSYVFNDWATSTELSYKYVAWGKSFDRKIEPVFFRALAGTGEVPTYSAYKQFTGDSSITSGADTPVTNGGSAGSTGNNGGSSGSGTGSSEDGSGTGSSGNGSDMGSSGDGSGSDDSSSDGSGSDGLDDSLGGS